MGTKKHRMTVGLDREDVQFLDQLGVFKNNAEAIRWCVKFCRLYGIPRIKKLKSAEKDTPAAGLVKERR